MKLIIVLLLLAVSVFSECECEKYVSPFNDEMTDVSTYSSKEYVRISADNKDGFLILMSVAHNGLNSAIGVIFEVYGASSCVDKGSKGIALFTDDTKVIFYSNTDYNCDKKFTSFFSKDFNAEAYEAFKTKRIKKLRLYTYNGSVEESLPFAQGNKFYCTFSCLDKYTR